MRAIDRWRSLDANARRLTSASALALCVTALLVRVIGVQRLFRYASRPVRGPAIGDHDIRDYVTAIDRAGRYAPGGTCLPKSLALVWMLRRRGVAADVRIGVRTTDRFESHAWVEVDGVALTDDRDANGGFATLTAVRR